MGNSNFENILVLLFGLFLIIRFRWFGKYAVEQKKKFEMRLYGKNWDPEKHGKRFNKTGVLVTQIMALIVGTLFVLSALKDLFT